MDIDARKHPPRLDWSDERPTVTIERETVEAAIEALEFHRGNYESASLDKLRAALAAQPAEPVAEVHAVHLRSSDENGGHWCREVLLYSGNSPHDWLNGKNTRVKLYTASPAPAAVPPGMVLVPVEPTPEMLRAAHDVFGNSLAKPCYRAMIAAAGDKP